MKNIALFLTFFTALSTAYANNSILKQEVEIVKTSINKVETLSRLDVVKQSDFSHILRELHPEMLAEGISYQFDYKNDIQFYGYTKDSKFGPNEGKKIKVKYNKNTTCLMEPKSGVWAVACKQENSIVYSGLIY